MKFISFNTNGIRARMHQLEELMNRHNPDVIGIQESKVADEMFPIKDIESLGLKANFYGQKSHYGVALLSKEDPIDVKLGIDPTSDEQRRLIQASFHHPNNHNETIHVLNGYFPQGESREHPTKFPCKEAFYQSVLARLQDDFNSDDNVIVMGDMNVAPNDIDIGIGEQNAKRWLRTGKCSFLPEEREWLEKLYQWGLEDTFRQEFPTEDKLSWFDYRSRGFEKEPKHGLRIDLILASKPLSKRLKSTGICHQIRGMEKPSDHCPIWFEID